MTRSPNVLARAATMQSNPFAQIAFPGVTFSDRFKDVWCGRQLSETVDDFLLRLPPATTEVSNDVPWIWIANPYEPVHVILEDSDNEPTGEEEGEKPNVNKMYIHGLNILQEFESSRFQIRQNGAGKPPGVIAREISREKDRTVMEIQKLAIELKCTGGKVCAERPLKEKD
jgi:hypothetical protein